ncbi:MAG: ATP-binding cassette domain-containing protein [Rhodospirillales bacterium]|nr:ATP-binding cassette domain-containing protein [Rhodospirillales bacterium]
MTSLSKIEAIDTDLADANPDSSKPPPMRGRAVMPRQRSRLRDAPPLPDKRAEALRPVAPKPRIEPTAPLAPRAAPKPAVREPRIEDLKVAPAAAPVPKVPAPAVAPLRAPESAPKLEPAGLKAASRPPAPPEASKPSIRLPPKPPAVEAKPEIPRPRVPLPELKAPQPAPKIQPSAEQPAAAPLRMPTAPAAAPRAPSPEERGELPSVAVLADSALAGLREKTDLSNCLVPLLQGMNWRGDPRHIAESIPHFVDNLDITSFRNVMANLHYESRPVRLRLHSVDPRLMPCLFLPDDGDALVLLGLDANHIRVFNGATASHAEVPIARTRGTVYFFTRLEEDDLLPVQQKIGWFNAMSDRFRGLVYQILGVTFVLNVLALATPLFTMAVYDKVIATGSLSTLAYFAIGVGISIACDAVLRIIRTRIMAYVGARLDNIVGNAVFHRILFLPPAFTERATVGAQVARMKDFETVRDFFTGPMALTFFELPFTIIFLVTIAFLGGPLVFVPIVMMAMFCLLAVVMQPLIRTSVSKAARGASRRQELLIETLGTMRAVKYSAAEHTWLERFRKASAKAALNSFYTAQYSSLVQTVSTILMTASGLATVVFGVYRVINGDMTVGALVASMTLVWRVLAPLQTVFVSLTRLTQVRSSINQINALMNLKAEREQHKLVTPIRRLAGRVSFSRVSLRYSPDTDPALVGVSFDIEPGEVVAVVGGNGSGKSTILKLIVGMYQPQAGNIRIDDQDIRQMDIIELRHAVAYVPQGFQFFYGTIAQNLRLAHPTATLNDLRRAADEAGVLQEIEAMQQGSGKWARRGFEIRIGDSGSGQMPTSVLQRLNLARGYLKRAPIMLFDEPGNGLDFAGDQAFMQRLDSLRGTTTALLVTHRPSHLKLADKMIWLEAGNVRAFGPAADVRKQMPKDFL